MVNACDRGRSGHRSCGQRLQCKDGKFNITFGQDHMWRAWVEVMGNPAWAQRPEFQTRESRTTHMPELQSHVEEWAAEHTKEEIYRMGQSRRVPVFPENSVADAVDSSQTVARGFLKELPLDCGGAVPAPSAAYQFQGMPWTIRHPAPRPGQHNREMLCGRLGLTEADLATAFEAGII